LNSVFRCNCGSEVFYDPNPKENRCWNCQKFAKPRFILRTQHQWISASRGKKLYEIQLRENFLDTASPIVGEIVTHPKDLNTLGLCNLTQANWTAQPSGEAKMITIPPGKSVPVLQGTIVNIGNYKVEFQSST
jgi:hypothetical protein